MIEIEKKFTLKEGDRERLLKDAEFVKKLVVNEEIWRDANLLRE